MGKMESSQNQELQYVEQIQRQQFMEFTSAWDNYMSEYEQNAFQSVERLRHEQIQELNEYRNTYLERQGNRYLPSRKLMDVRVMERKSFGVKQYEQAVQFSQLSESMEV